MSKTFKESGVKGRNLLMGNWWKISRTYDPKKTHVKSKTCKCGEKYLPTPKSPGMCIKCKYK